MYEEIALTGLNKKDYVSAKELWLIQKYAIINNQFDIAVPPEEYITDADLEIVI